MEISKAQASWTAWRVSGGKPFLTQTEAAWVSGMCQSTIYRYVRSGRLSLNQEGKVSAFELLRALDR